MREKKRVGSLLFFLSSILRGESRPLETVAIRRVTLLHKTELLKRYFRLSFGELIYLSLLRLGLNCSIGSYKASSALKVEIKGK